MHRPFILTDDLVRQLGEGLPLQLDGFATEEEVAEWSDAMVASDADFTRAGVGASGRQLVDVRSDRTAWHSDLPDRFHGMRERFIEVRTELNHMAWTGLDAFNIQLATFDPGGRYLAHRDALRGDPARRVTAILYLNRAWETEHGGCLRVHTSPSTPDIEPIGGRLVVFLSDLLRHEVLPSFAVRHAATAWFRGRDNPA